MMEYMLGKNVKAKLEGTVLTLTIDLSQNSGYSSTGKSVQIATTGGNIPLVGVDGVVKVGLNVFSPR